MNENKIKIKQYEQAADENVSLGGIKWERKWDVCVQCDSREEAERVRAALLQPEPEPVATVYDAYDTTGIDWHCKDAPATGTKLYTTPPQRKEWVGLTDEEMFFALISVDGDTKRLPQGFKNFAQAIEAKLKEKNT